MKLSKKKCFSCKKTLCVSKFYRDSSNSTGYESSCKKCRIKKDRELQPKSLKHKFYRLKVKADERSVPVNISFEQYCEAVKHRKCYYCDADTSMEKGGELNRIDSKKPYTVDNIKNCCKICNRIMNNFTKEELCARLYKIARRIK